MPRGPFEPPPPTSPRLQDERLRRLEDALAEGRAREQAAVEAWVRRTGQMPSRKMRRKWEKKWRREARREARDAADERSPTQGVAYAAVAVTCVLLALAQPRSLWWLVFVALGFFLSAAKHLDRRNRGQAAGWQEGEALGTGEAARGGQLGAGSAGHLGTFEARDAGLGAGRDGHFGTFEARPGARSSEHGDARPGAGPSPAQPSRDGTVDPRVGKVDALCAKLLAELRDGPAVLREVVHAPERTVEALRKGCHELVRRERELRAVTPPEEVQRLESEREALAARIAAEQDTVVRERLTGALTALDAQRRQRAELATAANRLEAEHTRLYYTLEGLYAQVLRVRSADAAGEDVAGAGLKQSVEQLGAEVEAVTRALEEVHQSPRPPPDTRTRTR